MISAVISTLNEAEGLAVTLASLVPAAVSGLVSQVVVADGGSTDATLEVVEDAGAKLVHSEGGLAAGCAAAKGPWLLLLDPGARLEAGWEAAARDHLAHHAQEAGYFRLALDDHRVRARLKEAWWALRTSVAGPSPEQGLLVSARAYGGRLRLRPLAAAVHPHPARLRRSDLPHFRGR